MQSFFYPLGNVGNSFFLQSVKLGNQHNPVQNGNSKQGNKPNSCRNGEVHPPNPECKNSADNRHWHCCKDQQSLFYRVEGEKQQHNNQQQCYRNCNSKPGFCRLQGLKLAAIGYIVAGWEFDFCVYLFFNIGNNTLDIAVTDIEPNSNASFGVFARDLCRPRFYFNTG